MKEKTPRLPWPASTALLSLACVPVAWVCLAAAARGWPAQDVAPSAFALIVLLGVDPFFMRRNHAFTLGGLAVVFVVGVGLAALGWLFRFNLIVFAWIGMTWALQVLAHQTERGRMIQYQIQQEKAHRTSWFNTKTEQTERMLVVYDFATVLLVGAVLLALWWA